MRESTITALIARLPAKIRGIESVRRALGGAWTKRGNEWVYTPGAVTDSIEDEGGAPVPRSEQHWR